MRIISILDELAATSSRNEKIAILKKYKDNKTLQKVCFLTLDPRTQFYIKKIPGYAPEEFGPIAIEWALDELNKFSSRYYTGNAAINHLSYILSHLSEDNAEVIERVIQRDLKCGVNDSTVNKVWKNLIPEYPYMRCALPKDAKFEKWNWKNGVYSQIKADGMFVNINHDVDGNVTLMSRSGSVLPNDPFSKLVLSIQNCLKQNTQTHGELLVRKAGKILPREIGNGILTSVLKGGQFEIDEDPLVEIWDQIPYGKDRDLRSYRQRYDSITSQFNDLQNIRIIETKIVYSMEEALEHYSNALSRGFEGTIIKNPEGEWKNGTSKDQIKLKLEVDVDLVIKGFTEGNGKNASTFGSITCQSSDGWLEVNVSGFKDKEQRGVMTRQEIWNKRDELIGTILAVRANNIMPPTKSNEKYSLFLPRAIDFRIDKQEADSLEQIQKQFESAIKRS
jgi:DNA ligase-1